MATMDVCDQEAPLAFQVLLSDERLKDLEDLAYDVNSGEPLDRPFRAPDDAAAFLSEVFDRSDQDKSGYLDKEEALDAFVLDLGFNERDAIKVISTLDSDDDTKLSKTEFLAAADLVHAMLQVREKEDNIDFITKVHQFSIKELKAAICQAKVLLEPRVKQLQAMAAAAKYQLKHSTRILCKQKCLLHKTSVMRAEISAARRAEREEEEQRQEREEEAKHAARCQSMAAEIEQKRRERAACLEAADLKTRPDGEGGYSKPFRRMAKERALLLAAEVEDAGKNKDLDLYLKMMKIATRWRQFSVDTAFGAWHENTKSVGGWKNRTPFRDRLINIAASMALKAQEELQGKVHAAAAGERRRQEVQMKQLFARKRSALARWHAKQSARQRQQEEEAEAEICARAQKRQQEREAKEMWQRDREKWIESMTLQQENSYLPPPTLSDQVSFRTSAARREIGDDPSKGRHGDARSKEYQQQVVRKVLNLRNASEWQGVLEAETDIAAVARALRKSDPEIAAWLQLALLDAQAWWDRQGHALQQQTHKQEAATRAARDKLKDLALQLEGQVLELEIKRLLDRPPPSSPSHQQESGLAHPIKTSPASNKASRASRGKAQPAHAGRIHRVSVCAPLLL